MECGQVKVPAHSEIVIEGFIHPETRVEDGPYPDHNGRLVTNPKAFLFEATRVMHRDDPIFRGRAIGKTGVEEQQLHAFLAELRLLDSQKSRFMQMVHSLVSAETWRCAEASNKRERLTESVLCYLH
jgi:UbiD family decarboxylase